MRFNLKTEEQKKKEHLDKITKWHRFFAWYPIRIKDIDCRWLEFVERKFVPDQFCDSSIESAVFHVRGYWKYRKLKNEI